MLKNHRIEQKLKLMNWRRDIFGAWAKSIVDVVKQLEDKK